MERHICEISISWEVMWLIFRVTHWRHFHSPKITSTIHRVWISDENPVSTRRQSDVVATSVNVATTSDRRRVLIGNASANFLPTFTVISSQFGNYLCNPRELLRHLCFLLKIDKFLVKMNTTKFFFYIKDTVRSFSMKTPKKNIFAVLNRSVTELSNHIIFYWKKIPEGLQN